MEMVLLEKESKIKEETLNKGFLIGCIDKIKSFKSIQTRFFYLNSETAEIKDVTLELCNAIQDLNKKLRKSKTSKHEYVKIIPYEYKYGLAEYPFGCGLSHHLNENIFEELSENVSFPIENCKLKIYTQNDIRYLLSVKGVFDKEIEQALLDFSKAM